MEELFVRVHDQEIRISNPNKALWPEPRITKLDYINYLLSVADFLLPYTRDRLLMIWCFPDGIEGKRIVRKAIPSFAPEWVPRFHYKDKYWILLNDTPTLVWLGNLAALELHVPFDTCHRINYPTELVFDLDPMDVDNFDLVREIALELKELLDSLHLFSIPKTSGATGLQIYVPVEPKYSFEDARKINQFIARYLAEKKPAKITLERAIQNRGQKLYFDYLQLWKMRTLPAPYSARAIAGGRVSMPVTWEEVAKGFHNSHFTMLNAAERLRQVGDLFSPVTTEKKKYRQSLDHILAFIKGIS